MGMSYNKTFIVLLFFFPVILFCQNSATVVFPGLPVPQTPKVPVAGHSYNYPGQRGNNNHLPEISPQERNANLMREIEAYEAQMHNQKTRNKRDADYLIRNGFAFQGNNPAATGCEHYYLALDTISRMLSGEIPLHLGKAIFLTENAFYGGRLDYGEYEKILKEKAEICTMLMKQENLNQSDNTAKNSALFRLMTDTLHIKLPGNEKPFTHYPVRYDLEDYKSEKNYDSHFVTKLIRTNEGQCNSMPLYYLAIAEQLGVEAYRAFSPRHSFVRIQDDMGEWHNIELTNGHIMSDAHYMNNSYIKAEALQSKIYMEAMTTSETVAELLNDLAHSYIGKYGYDDFTLWCTDIAKKYNSRHLNSWMLEADYYTRLTIIIANLLEAKNPQILKEISPQAYRYHLKMLELYQLIDDSGFEELPVDLYERWLEHVARLKEGTGKN